MRVKGWLAGVSVLSAVLRCAATEGGGGAYPNGAEGMMAGAVPPPGQYFISYTAFYQADSWRDGHGRDAGNDLELRAMAETLRFLNVTSVEVLGGLWAQQLIVPLVDLDVSLMNGAVKDHESGVGDVLVDPFVVAWHHAPFHWVVGVETFLPVGKYDADSLANIGRNYWTFEPAAAVTYLNEGGQELSVKAMYDFNTENQDTEYRSGQEFHADFAAAQHCGAWAAGLGGFWYRQTTEDRAGGQDRGNRGRQLAIGPQVSYQCGGINLALSWDHEMCTENRPQGDKVWLKAVLPL